MSIVVEVLKKESKKEYTNRAIKASIDFPIGASTNHSSELTGLILRFSLPDTTYKIHAQSLKSM